MPDNIFESKIVQIKPDYLWFLTLTYAMVIVLSNWFVPRLIKIFNLTTDAGTLIFPLTFLLSDLITEVYGFKHARRAIWCGFLFNALFIIYSQTVIHMPGPDFPTNNAMFDTLLATSARIIIASAISYLCAEPLNSLMMAKLKIKMKGRFMSLRFVLSTVIASGTDSIIFIMIAFYNVIPHDQLISMILSMWLIKVAIEILGLPVSTRLANQLKQIEKLDIYDKRTAFNLFRLETNYLENDNEFKK